LPDIYDPDGDKYILSVDLGEAFVFTEIRNTNTFDFKPRG